MPDTTIAAMPNQASDVQNQVTSEPSWMKILRAQPMNNLHRLLGNEGGVVAESFPLNGTNQSQGNGQ